VNACAVVLPSAYTTNPPAPAPTTCVDTGNDNTDATDATDDTDNANAPATPTSAAVVDPAPANASATGLVICSAPA
jgi:hypothetical protein